MTVTSKCRLEPYQREKERKIPAVMMMMMCLLTVPLLASMSLSLSCPRSEPEVDPKVLRKENVPRELAPE